MNPFERKLKHLSWKDWADLRSFWLRHIPDIDQLGQEPEETLEQDEELRREASSAPSNGEHRFIAEVNPASLLFRESVFVLCKAIRISCESAQQAINGLPTWSISTAHHSSMFALRAFLGLCGIAYIEIENRYFLVDILPSQRKGHRQQKVPFLTDNKELQLIKVPQMGHSEWWSVYKRILRISKNFSWCFPVDTELAQCDTGTLSKHRNELHYRIRWFYEDLLEVKVMPSFGWFNNEAAETVVKKLEDSDGSDGSLILNQMLLGNSLLMLRDLSKLNPSANIITATIEGAIEKFKNDIVENWYSRLS